MSENKATILDLDSMLDTAMDTIETLPDYVTPPAGSYVLKVLEAKSEKYKPKDAKQPEGMRLKIQYSVSATLELADSKELPVKDGSLFSESFMATEDGLKYFKRQAMNIMNVDDLGKASLRDVMDGMKNEEFKARITIKKTSGDNGAVYENIQVRPVHEAS